MRCCTLEGTDKLFSSQARRYAKRFRRRGLDKAQQSIATALERLGVEQKSILEIGCGIGGLHLMLLKRGAISAVGVEISGGMIEKANELATELGVKEKTTYYQGDIIFADGRIPSADIVILDKVLCCHPDPKLLVERSTEKARTLYAVSYPRDNWLARLLFASSEKIGTLFRWSFHPFYHKPSLLDSMIVSQGLAVVYSETTLIWQVKIFRKG